MNKIKGDVLKVEHLRRILELPRDPSPPVPTLLHKDQWDDYKRLFNLTDEQMGISFWRL